MENLDNNDILRPFQLAEQAPLSIAFLDEQLKIVYLNSSCLNSLRASQEVSIEQIVGMSLSELLSLSEDQLAIIKSSDNNPVTILPGLTDSSSEVLITPFLDESNPLIGRMAIWKNFLIQDNEESTELSMLQLLAMRSVFSTLSGHKTFETALQATISATSMCFGIPMCCYWEKDLASGDLLQRFAWSYDNQTEVETSATIKRGQGGVGKAWQTRLTTFTEDFEQSHDPRLESAEFSSKVRSSIAIPIIAHGNLHGVLEFLSPATLGALSAGVDVFNTLGKILGHFASQNGRSRGSLTQSDDASLQCSVVKAIAGLRDSDQLLQIIVSSVTEHFNWEYGAYWAIENESDFIRTHVGGSVCPNVSRLTLPDDSLVTAAIASLNVVSTTDSNRLEDSPRFPEMNRCHLKAGAIIPICNKDQVLGFFEFFTSNPDSLTHSRQNSIRELGELLPSFIINNNANDELQEATKDAEAIGEVVADLAGCQSADEAAMLALNLLAETYEWDFLAYWTWTPDKQRLKSDIQVGEISDPFYDASSELTLTVGAGPVGIAWEQAEFTICDLNEHTDNSDPRIEAALAEGADTAIYMPILDNGEIVSLIEVILKNCQGFSKSKQTNLKLLHTTLDNAFNRILKLCEQVEANQNSDSLSTLMERIDTAHTYDTTLQVALDSIKELFDWDYGAYFDYNPTSQALTFHSSTGTLSEEYSELTSTTQYKLGEGLLGSALENQETVTFPVMDQMPDSEPRKANAIEAGCQTYLAIPILIEEKIFGVLEFYLTYQQSFSAVRVGALRSMSKIVGNALQKALQKALQQQEKLALEQEQKEKTSAVIRFVNEVENGNLVAELNIQGQDPIGRIASGLRNLVSTIRSIFEQFSQFGQDLADAARKMSEVSEQLNKNADQTSNQSLEAQSASQTAHETAQAVAAAAEEMSASISEISKNVSEASAITNSATRRADEAMKLVVSLGQRSEEIGEVVKLINSIASQTNLLALNATIEAARAGEVGRGFAVVANEVKELARGTANATQEISTKISGVQAETTSVIDIMKEIADTIINLSTLSQGVTGSISQQSSTTAEISQSIGNAAQQIGVIGSRISTVTDLAAHTKQAAHESATDSSTLNTMANQLIQMLKIYKLR